MEQQEQTAKIKAKAFDLGFLDCGISKADFLAEEKPRLERWLNQGLHGEMSYMKRHFDMRLDPRLIFEGAKSIISVLLNYYPKREQQDQQAPVLSKYAYGKDYHFVMKDKLNALLVFIQEEIAPCHGRAFVDSAPVLDKAWAAKAGLGWVGKHTNLISVEHGSFFFIGELIVDLELPANKKTIRDHCGTCTRCIDACPTQAIVAPQVVDARRCISYQTIELKGELDENLKDQFEDRVFGCDICQDICPWNLKSQPHQEPEFDPHPKLMELTRNEWMEMDKPLFRELFRKSAVKRTKFEGLKRNLKFIETTSTPD